MGLGILLDRSFLLGVGAKKAMSWVGFCVRLMLCGCAEADVDAEASSGRLLSSAWSVMDIADWPDALSSNFAGRSLC